VENIQDEPRNSCSAKKYFNVKYKAIHPFLVVVVVVGGRVLGLEPRAGCMLSIHYTSISIPENLISSQKHLK
jgi:hypothetical protein